MSQTADRRRRTDLDLFLLALIESGISTPYRLQKEAGLSQGATIPTLQRLLQAGFVRMGTLGGRRRTSYQVTASGKQALRSGWRPLIDSGPIGALDADLRVALLALWVAGDLQAAADYLRRSAAQIKESVNPTESDSEASSTLAQLYCALRSVSGKTLREAESQAMRVMAETLLQTKEFKQTREALLEVFQKAHTSF